MTLFQFNVNPAPDVCWVIKSKNLTLSVMNRKNVPERISQEDSAWRQQLQNDEFTV